MNFYNYIYSKFKNMKILDWLQENWDIAVLILIVIVGGILIIISL
jgi:hypothetical protein